MADLVDQLLRPTTTIPLLGQKTAFNPRRDGRLVRGLTRRGLFKVVVREWSFPDAGQEVTVTIPAQYADGQIPVRMAFQVVYGDRRAVVRNSGTAWTSGFAYLVSDMDGIKADLMFIYR